MSTLRDKFINEIIDREGGYVDDPEDSGGATNYGITEQVARRYGYEGDMKDLPRNTAFDIYAKKYWYSMNLDRVEELSPLIVEEIADTSVHVGQHRAAVFLQRVLNAFNNRERLYKDIKKDGDIGTKTIGALKAFISNRGEPGCVVLSRALNSMQGSFYIFLVERREKDEKFIFGWFKNRVE